MKIDNPDDIWDGVETCPVHPEGYQWPDDFNNPDHWSQCLGCQAEQMARSQVIDAIQEEAQKRLHGIAQQGGPQLPPWTILEVKVDTLLDSLFRTPRDRTRYEAEVGRRVLLMIRDMQEQIKQPTLHVARDIPADIRMRRG